jgi:hypothetical protein
MGARNPILVRLLLVVLLAGCAKHELVLSSALRPALSSQEIDFPVEHFRARVGQSGDLEVWARVNQSISDYREDFDNEIHDAAALCAALTNFDRTFGIDWSNLDLHLTNEYGSQARWKTAHSFTRVSMSRVTLFELRKRKARASAYPKYWRVSASKVGPPDYVYFEWSPGDVNSTSSRDGR